MAGACQHAWRSYVGSGGLNSGPITCMASILPIELSLQPALLLPQEKEKECAEHPVKKSRPKKEKETARSFIFITPEEKQILCAL